MKKISEEELILLFRKLGANDPESWALSEINEDIPQLARFLFLLSAWKTVIAEGDLNWINQEIEYSKKQPDKNGAGVGLALEKLLKSGVNPEDITDIVRGMQYQTLHGICYLLDGLNENLPEIGDFGWSLFERDKEGNITGRIIQGLYESVLSMDPSGKELLPRKDNKQDSF